MTNKLSYKNLLIGVLIIIIAICVITITTNTPNGQETDLIIKRKQDSIALLQKQKETILLSLKKSEMIIAKQDSLLKIKKQEIIIIDSTYDKNSDNIIHLDLDNSIRLLSEYLSSKTRLQ